MGEWGVGFVYDGNNVPGGPYWTDEGGILHGRKASSVLHTSGCARRSCSMRYEDGQLMHKWVYCTGGFAYDGRIVPWGTGLMNVNKCMAARHPAFNISSDCHVGIAT